MMAFCLCNLSPHHYLPTSSCPLWLYKSKHTAHGLLLPLQAQEADVRSIFDRKLNITVLVNSTRAGNNWPQLAYGISSVAALTFNLLTLFLGTFLSIVLCLVPSNAVKLYDCASALAAGAVDMVGPLRCTVVCAGDLIPGQSPPVTHCSFTSRMRGVLVLPAFGLALAASASITSWWTLGEVGAGMAATPVRPPAHQA